MAKYAIGYIIFFRDFNNAFHEFVPQDGDLGCFSYPSRVPDCIVTAEQGNISHCGLWPQVKSHHNRSLLSLISVIIF